MASVVLRPPAPAARAFSLVHTVKLKAIPMRVPMVDTSIARPIAKEALPHYQTNDHREWSRIVIARARGMCQRPGCGRVGVRLFADHIIELKDGGKPFDLSNGQALCGSCHTTKTARARAERMTR